MLRGTERCRSLPIIALTADGMLGDHEKSLAAGMDDHLPKPIDPESLMAAVRRWVRPAGELHERHGLKCFQRIFVDRNAACR